MVPGDIDLTENLDFRKSRKATIPKIPWSKLHDNIISEDMLNSVTMPISSTNIEFRVTGNTMRITYDDFTTDTLYIRYDNSSWFDISSTNSYTNSSMVNVNNYYPKKDIFGNIIKEEAPIPKLCYYSHKQKKKIPKLPYHDEPKECIPYLPWNDVYTPFCNFYKKKIEQICYLNGMSSGERRDYLRRNTIDYSSYLTNMHHIRVRDAIIE